MIIKFVYKQRLRNPEQLNAKNISEKTRYPSLTVRLAFVKSVVAEMSTPSIKT